MNEAICFPRSRLCTVMVAVYEKFGRHTHAMRLLDSADFETQFIKNHQKVPEATYADPNGPIRLPHPEEVPNVDIEVVNYHRPMLGTFHAKFMVVDRRIALVQSNNLQDNDNMEMCVQLEGAIVDSVYDTAITTWNDPLTPQLPLLSSPAAGSEPPTFQLGNHGSLFHSKDSLVKNDK